MELLYTVTRNMQADSDELPNAFLFASQEKPSDEQMLALLSDKDLRGLLAKNQPAFVVRYSKKEDTKHGFLPEWRLVLTTLTYYSLPISDERDNVSIAWEDEKQNAVVVHWKSLLDNCVELYRVDGCQGCPKKGLECVKQQFGQTFNKEPFQPWFMKFSYNRKDEWSTGLADDGTVNERTERNRQHSFNCGGYNELVKMLTKMHPLGATFIAPTNTKLNATPKMNHPLRPGRDHRFFKDPAHKDDKIEKANP